MAIALVSSGIADNGASSVSTASHTFNAGTLTSNGVLIGFLFVGSTAITSPSMTWNGVSMFLIPSTQHNAAGTGTTILFGIRNPASGSNSLSASWTNAGPAALGFWSFTGADQAADNTTFINGVSVDNAGGSSSEGPTTVTTASGNATVYGWSGGVSFSGTQTPTADWQNNGGLSGFNYEGQHVLSSTSSDSYTVAISGTDWISGSGCCIKAAASAAIVASWYSAFEPPPRLIRALASFQETQTALSTQAPRENHFPPLFDIVALLKKQTGFVDLEVPPAGAVRPLPAFEPLPPKLILRPPGFQENHTNIQTIAAPSYQTALFDPAKPLKLQAGFVDSKIAPAPVAVAAITQDQTFPPPKPLKVQPGFVHLDINIATQAPLTNHFPTFFDPVSLQKRPAGFDDRPWPIVPTPPLRTEPFFPVLRLKQNIEFQQQYQNPTITAVTPPVFTLSPSFDPSVKLRPPDSSFFYTPQFIFVAPSQLKITDTTHLQLPINAILMGQQDYEEGESIIEAQDPNYRTKIKVSFGGGGKLSSNDPTFTTTTSKKGYD